MSAIGMHAQLLEVLSMERVRLPLGVQAEQALLSPDGKTFAFSDFSGKLKIYDRATEKVNHVSDHGSMMDLAFTEDSRTIVYRESSYDNSHRRLVAVNAYDLGSRASRCIVAPSRELQALNVRGLSALTVHGGRAKVCAAKGTKAASQWPVLSIERGLLYITENGERRLASPLGTSGMSYLWASISPDGQRMLFFAAGYGTYTCRLDGSDLHSLGYLYAPVWYDDNIVVGMKTKDDGRVTYQGSIIASDIYGKSSQVLTDSSLVAVLPTAVPGRICFTTTDGGLFIINVKQ